MSKEIKKTDDLPYTPAEDEYRPDVLDVISVGWLKPKKLPEPPAQVEDKKQIT